jgi:AcrR family transcriptional regulator
MTSDSEIFQRRKPKQSRSRATCDAILEAASQILERDGSAGFNTASVAERAGVSIGTLYQYFPDKQAILLAAAQREMSSEAAPSRQKILMRALIDWVETLGRLAAGAPVRSGAAAVRKLNRPRSELERRALAWIDDGLAVLRRQRLAGPPLGELARSD